MEMVLIKSAVEREGANGPWLSVETDIGKMSAFDKGIREFITSHIGSRVKLDVKKVEKDSKCYMNIRGYDENFRQETENYKAGAEIKPSYLGKNICDSDKKSNGKKEMYVSYAKDIFIKILDDKRFDGMNLSEVMHDTILLVKEARDAF